SARHTTQEAAESPARKRSQSAVGSDNGVRRLRSCDGELRRRARWRVGSSSSNQKGIMALQVVPPSSQLRFCGRGRLRAALGWALLVFSLDVACGSSKDDSGNGAGGAGPTGAGGGFGSGGLTPSAGATSSGGTTSIGGTTSSSGGMIGGVGGSGGAGAGGVAASAGGSSGASMGGTTG